VHGCFVLYLRVSIGRQGVLDGIHTCMCLSVLIRRRKKSPIDVFKVPLTAAQQVGWHEEVVINKRYPKKSCEETRYQDAVVKARWF